jgi:threonylcarbamoyladenosine tRNA methylthiotransferase MtaB
MSAPRVAFKTIGCRLNKAETAQIAAGFEAAGFRIVPFGKPCEVCVIHSCAVTRHAEWTSARAARRARRGGENPVVVVAGCAAETNPDALRRASGADLLAGQADKFRLPSLLQQLAPRATAPAGDPLLPRFDSVRAWIKVQNGCDFGCAYCIVPRARGRSRSRPVAEILAEVRGVAANGYKEIVLTGANLGGYDDGGRNLLDLIAEIETVAGVERIRLSSIEMTTVERAVIDRMCDSGKLCRFLHVPLQSGDDRVLGAMGRRYTSREYRAFVEYAAGRLPRLGLGTDVMAGFPGEDDGAFEATVRLIEELPFSNLHVFPYSRREGTRAAEAAGQIAEPVKKTRVRRLLGLRDAKRSAFAEGWVGQPVSVLVERVDAEGAGRGWTGEYVAASVPGGRVNEIVEFIPEAVRNGVLGAAGRTR